MTEVLSVAYLRVEVLLGGCRGLRSCVLEGRLSCYLTFFKMYDVFS